MSSFIRVIGTTALVISGIAFALGIASFFASDTDYASGALGFALPGIIGGCLLVGFADLMENVAAIRKAFTPGNVPRRT